MTKLRINEAIARAKDAGRVTTKKEIAARIFPGRPETTQQINFNNMCNGHRQRIDPDHIVALCDILGCDPNYLFNYQKEDNK